MTKKTRYFMAGSGAVMAAALCTGLVAYYAGGFQPVSASAVSNELRYVPADATVVAYADVRAIMDSELRARLKQAMPMQEQGQQEFQQQTGIDIERDIDYVVAAMSPKIGEHMDGAGLVVARGRFNDSLLETLAREHGGTVEEYKGKRMVVSPAHQLPADSPVQVQPKSIVLAFLEPGLVALGDAVTVKAAIDAQMSSHSITSNDEMMQLVGDIGSGNNAWAVGRFDVIASQAQLPEQVKAQIPPVKWFAVAGHVNGGLSGTVRAEARDDQSAENLRDVVRGFLALARLQTQADPRTAGLVDSLQLGGTGKTVSLSFSVPAEILNLIPKGQPAQPAELPKELHELK
jgi:hypothetical protein